MPADGPVVAMRRRPVLALGGLQERALTSPDGVGRQLVAAHDLSGSTWWIPAEAVWTDSSTGERPQHPRPTGLSTADGEAAAILGGISDRLGWEAVEQRRQGLDLPLLDASIFSPGLGPCQPGSTMMFDGRLDHDIPTVVVAGAHVLRWGAGQTWDDALHRAMYRSGAPASALSTEAELAWVSSRLDAAGLSIGVVDLGTTLLRQAGIARCSVQLCPSNEAGRSWDGARLN
ncbi:MAG: hypothetical protein M3337_01840 [Actinomycetota bacterium]|nr:hypothetical protein [Actinomycetota bacterium]